MASGAAVWPSLPFPSQFLLDTMDPLDLINLGGDTSLAIKMVAILKQEVQNSTNALDEIQAWLQSAQGEDEPSESSEDSEEDDDSDEDEPGMLSQLGSRLASIEDTMKALRTQTFDGERNKDNAGRAGKSNTNNEMSQKSKEGQVEKSNDAVFKHPATKIAVPKNSPRVIMKKVKMAPKPEQSKPQAPVKERVVYKINNSAPFQIFWKKLGIRPEVLESRRFLRKPVCGTKEWTRVDLKRHLDSIFQPHGFTPDFLFLREGLLRWDREKANAMAFSPLRVIDRGEWKANMVFANAVGDPVEVFFVAFWGVCYAGTYTCHHALDYFPEGVIKPADINAASLSRATLEMFDSKRGESDSLKFKGKYKQGVMKLDCAILECMGFNEEIQQKLNDSWPRGAKRALDIDQDTVVAKKAKK
ncbi:hypothetical protein H0H93_011972 [Arthromyces matolae]|nr:hypothetical protein H0H93_011972 [Arthromyces matolae]